MPTYQYACTACDHRFDAVQSFTENALTVCPQCSGRLRKVFSSVGIVFKGSGFYRTDSRATQSVNGSSAKDAPGDKVGSTDSGSKDSGSKDSGSRERGGKEPARTGSGSNGSGAKRGSPAGAGTSRPSTGSGSAA